MGRNQIDSNKRWSKKTLSQVCQKVEKVNPKHNPNDYFSYIDISAIDNSTHQITNPNRILGRDAPSRARQRVKAGDTLFSTVRVYLKNIAIVPESLDGAICSTGFCVLRPSSEIHPRFLFRYVMRDEFIDVVTPKQTGTMYPAVKQENLLSQDIEYPHLSEQEVIAAKIDQSLGSSQRVKYELSRIPALTRRLRMAILSKAFRGELTERNPNDTSVEALLEKIRNNDSVNKLYEECGKKWASSGLRKKPINELSLQELPAGWEYIELGRWIYIAGRIGWRGLKAEEYTEDGPLFLSVHNLNKGDIVDLSKSYHISLERYEESPEIRLRNDDILLTKDGAGIGKIGIVKNLNKPATVNSSLLVIRGGNLFFPEYLFYMLKGPEMQKIVNERITGSATPHLFQRDIRNFILPVAPYEEQIRIVSIIKPSMTFIDSLVRQSEAVNELLAHLEKSILTKAFRGELVDSNHFGIRT